MGRGQDWLWVSLDYGRGKEIAISRSEAWSCWAAKGRFTDKEQEVVYRLLETSSTWRPECFEASPKDLAIGISSPSDCVASRLLCT